MKVNPEECNLLVATNELISVYLNSFQILYSTEVKLHGFKFDSKLSFENHDASLCKKASQTLHAITMVVNYINLSKQNALMETLLYPSLTTAH